MIGWGYVITHRGLVVVAFVVIIKRVRRKPVAKLKGDLGRCPIT